MKGGEWQKKALKIIQYRAGQVLKIIVPTQTAAVGTYLEGKLVNKWTILFTLDDILCFLHYLWI